MKLTLPLPIQNQGDKKYPIDYRKGSICCPNIEQRVGKILSSHMYKCGLDFGFDGFYESDIKWIENNITKNSQNKNRDIFWRFEDYTHAKNISPYILDYMTTFFQGFIDKPGISRSVNRLLISTVGYMRAWYQKWEPEPYQHFLVESWLRKNRQGR